AEKNPVFERGSAKTGKNVRFLILGVPVSKSGVYCRVTFPEFATINRVLLEQYYIHAEERAFTARIPGAAERYDYFAKSGNKHLLQRVPHKYLASLLGVRPETLSRIITNS
ncbi:hypothetical protein SAMN05421761_1354, partial [Belliella pelovolcani]